VKLQQALRDVTEYLAAELAAPSSRAPAWSELQWTVARAVAAMHGVSPLLSHSLKWRGPAEWSSFLESQWRHTARRQVRICSVLQHLDAGARDCGIAVMALKGAALHELGLYAAGDRPMADIDLLVRPADSASLSALLRTMDYQLSSANWRESIYVPAIDRDPAPIGEHAGNSVKIESHERIGERLAGRVTDISGCLFPAHPRAGLNPYDSKAALMMHLLLHAAGSMSRQSLRLLQLHDVALLSSHMTAADWQEFKRGGHGIWWAYPPLRIVQRYYADMIPAGVLAHAAAECPFWLRAAAARATLYEVSLSYPWVDAFPALAWVQSPAELLEYITNRLKPPASLLLARQHTLKTEHWARRAEWGGLSQGRRILRWATSRPTRPATLNALAAAFTPSESYAAYI
jgi:Uncharacterised nucleotidyltransferase